MSKLRPWLPPSGRSVVDIHVASTFRWKRRKSALDEGDQLLEQHRDEGVLGQRRDRVTLADDAFVADEAAATAARGSEEERGTLALGVERQLDELFGGSLERQPDGFAGGRHL